MINPSKTRPATGLALLAAVLALYAALTGVLDERLYQDALAAGAMTDFLVPGSIAQDYVSILLGAALTVAAGIFLRRPGLLLFIVVLGLTSFFFYAYGLYVMQGQYTSLYLVYLAIFGLSLYALILGLLSLDWTKAQSYRLTKMLRWSAGAFLMLLLLVLTPIWLVLLMGDIAKYNPRDTYAVFILDLAIVFPALGIIAAGLFRNRPFSRILAGVALIKAFTVCLSVAFGEWFVAAYGGFAPQSGMIALFGGLTVISLGLIGWYFVDLRVLDFGR